MSRRRFGSGLALCLLLAAALRFLGIMHGWPRNYVPDTTVVRAALSIGAGANPLAGDPLPTQYPYFLPYVLAVVYGAWFAGGWATGFFPDARAFEAWAFANPEAFFLVAGVVVASFGCWLVWLVAAVTRRLLGEPAALLAALFSATSLILVQLSHQARPHLVATALVFAALHFTLLHVDESRPRALVLGWLFAGLAAAAVPYALLSAAIPALGSVRRGDARRGARDLSIGAAVFLAVQVFFYPRFVAGDGIRYESSTGLFRSYGGLYLSDALVTGGGFPKLLGWIVTYEPVLAVLAAAGIAIAIRRRRWSARWAVTAVFPLLYVLVYGSYEVIHPRYLVPLVPFLSIPAAWVAVRGQRRVSRAATAAWGARFGPVAAAGFAAVLLLPPLAQAVRFDVLLRREDTRSIAERWIADNLGASALIATEAHGVDLPLDEGALRWAAANRPQQLGVKDRHRLRLAERGALADGYPVRRLWHLEGYRQSAVGDLAGEVGGGHVVAVVHGDVTRDDLFYRTLQRDGRLLLRVSPLRPGVRRAETRLPLELQRPLWGLWQVERCGPIIEVYELKRP